MAGTTISVEGLLADFPTPIFPKIGGGPTRKGLIDIHRLINWEYGFRGVEPQRRPTRTPRADDDG